MASALRHKLVEKGAVTRGLGMTLSFTVPDPASASKEVAPRFGQMRPDPALNRPAHTPETTSRARRASVPE